MKKNGFTCIPVAEGVYQVQLTHFAYRQVNAYLLAGSPLTLIDTGHLESAAFTNLEKALATLGYTINDIEQIVYTHPHIDHLGGGVIINERNPSVQNVGYAAAAGAFKDQKRFNVALTESAHRFFNSRGSKAPPEHLTEVNQFFTDYLICNDQTGITLTRTVEEGAVTPAGQFELHVLHTPSHTPWDISLYEPRNGLIFSGDSVLEKVASLFSGIIFSDYDGYISVLERMESLELSAIFPGHGRPIEQPYEVIENWKGHLARRSEKISGLLKQGTGDVFDIVSTLLADDAGLGDSWHRLLGFVDTYLMKLVREEKAEQVWEGEKVRYVWKG